MKLLHPLNLRKIVAALLFLFMGFGLSSLDTSKLKEIWAFLVSDEPKEYKEKMPVTDLAFFAASLNSRAQLVGVPSTKSYKDAKVRRHLVLENLSNMALVHFAMDESLPLRQALIGDLVKALADFDGLMIDFEEVSIYDRDSFLSFLKALRSQIGSKMLSVALPARTRANDEWFDYKNIAPLVDRVFLMSYDEHWSSSEPGPISSIEVGTKIAGYAKTVIDPSKLIMGLPFYGRVWGSENPAHAYRSSLINGLAKETGAKVKTREDGVPYFSFKKTITYTGYFENKASLVAKIEAYQGLGIMNIGFWRLGQEEGDFWDVLK